MKYIIVIFLSLLLTNFFGATGINNTISLGLIFPFVVIEFSKQSIFKRYIVFVFIGLTLSMISCYYNWEQSMFVTLRVTAPYYYILFYFMLKNINLTVPDMEKALFVLVVIFCVCYILQYIVYPKVIFSGAEVEYDDVRIRLVGQGFSSLGYFFGLNKYLKNNTKTSYLLLSVLCFSVILLMGFRTMLVMIAISTFLMVIRVNGFSRKLLWYSLLFSGFFIAIFQIPVFADKINSMLDRQEESVFSNSDYSRVIQFQYFTQEHFKSIWEYIFGSGIPALAKQGGLISEYGLYMSGLEDTGINYVDFGLLSLSWMIGITAVISMIAYSIKAFLLKVSANYYYLGIWFIYLLITSFTTMEFYRPGNFIVQAIALFLVEKVHHDHLRRKKINQIENWNTNISPSS